MQLAKAMVLAMEDEFENQFGKKARETLVAEDGDGSDVEGEGAVVPSRLPSSSDDDEPAATDASLPKISPAVKQAVKRLHENTGHRSNRRLARALVISGAPPEVVRAARLHKCSVCQEMKGPKSQRPSSLPTVRDVSDQVHIDIFEAYDVNEQRFYVVHAIDHCSRFQLAQVLPDKSSKSVIAFLQRKWLPIFGAPRVLVADQGREFVSWEFEQLCAENSILLWHCAVQAPWQNGVCERGGGILKSILKAVIASQSVSGADEMDLALQEAVTSYNGDVNELGVSPAQAALGRQPRLQGDVLGDFGQRVAEHGLVDSRPSLARQVAMRETARVAIARLHFSRGLRKALLARSRDTTMTQQPLEPGSIVYYFRQTKYNNKTSGSKKKLSLKRWHGPALLVANEGLTNCFLSHKGQLTKCAREHVRLASSMEQISAETWRDAIDDVVEAALHDRALQEQQLHGGQVQPFEEGQRSELPQPPELSAPSEPALRPEPVLQQEQNEAQASTDLPPVAPREFADALKPGIDGGTSIASMPPSMPASSVPSRKSSMVGTGGRSGSPVPDLVLRAAGQSMSTSLPSTTLPAGMSRVLERAVEVDAEATRGKREAELSLEQLAETTRQESNESLVATHQRTCFDALVLNHEEMTNAMKRDDLHPLRRLCFEAAEERADGCLAVEDRGSWKGCWPLPSRSQLRAMKLAGTMLPRGEQEAMAATARKEYKWRELSPADKEKFREAAADGWNVWVQNDAVEVLKPEVAKHVRERLKQTQQSSLILKPRYVFTDKNDGLRTESNPLPIRASARLVVPGYKDISAYTVRKDAPTASRTSVHMLLVFTSSNKWHLMSADVKSAFLKGELFAEGELILYIENVQTSDPTEPLLPLGEGGLARLRKGIFGLSDSPRRWYLRLHKSLTRLGWRRSEVDGALWMLWSPDGKTLEGMICSHVDDLLFGGNDRAKALLLELGKELGYGSLEEKAFHYCGKYIEMNDEHEISVSMEEYHSNLKPLVISTERRKTPDATLLPNEHKQLRALLGSLQWLVAQVRFDLGFPLCTLQGEPPTVGTMLRANALLKRFKQNPKFALRFKPLNLEGCGLMVVSDASLGNVQRNGAAGDDPMVKVFSQSAYIVLVADRDLMAGRTGKFAVLDARSHRLSRVCRSTYAAELLGIEEAFDTGIYCRGCLAEAFGYPMDLKNVTESLTAIPLTAVTDAKDVYDKGNSDTPSFGSQKSLAFTVSWLRSVLRQPNTCLRWTSTQNMIIDALTKDMDLTHLHKILDSGQWCVKFSQDFIKQTSKPSKSTALADDVKVGKPLSPQDPLLSRLMILSESPGWHMQDNVVVHVAKNAKAFRTPKPRHDPKEFSLRSSYGRFDLKNGSAEWRQLERDVLYEDLPYSCTGQIGQTASVLVTFFRMQSHFNKRDESTEKSEAFHG